MIMNPIDSLQNKEESISKLSAMREAYSGSKSILLVNLYLSVVAATLLSFVTLALNSQEITSLVGLQKRDISTWASSYGILIALLDVFLMSRIIKSKRELGAIIQEDFDTSVFQIPWNHILVGERPSPERIYELKQKYLKRDNPETLSNWYPVDDQNLAGDPVSIIICQRTNLEWDSSLRRAAQLLSSLGLALSFISLVAVGIWLDVSLSQFVFSIFVPAFPLFLYGIKLFTEHSQSISRTTQVKGHAENIIQDIQTSNIDAETAARTVRQLQDAIYTHRSTSRPISDRLHKFFKKGYEEKARYAAKSLRT